MKIDLGLHLGFAATRYNDPKIWSEIVRKEFDLDYVQFVSDLIDPDLPDKIINREINRTKFYLKKYNIRIKHAMTLPRNNYLGHYNIDIREYWLKWLKKFVNISSKLGADGAGSLLGIYSFDQLKNNFIETRKNIIKGWIDLSAHAKRCGLKYLIWEPMSVKREMGETIIEIKKLHKELNKKSKIPILLNLDVDHGDISSKNKSDFNPYEILKQVGIFSPAIHLKQKTKDIYAHKPFIKKYNKNGLIKPKKIINILKKNKLDEVTLYFEFTFREREPHDTLAIKHIKESVKYWRKYLNGNN